MAILLNNNGFEDRGWMEALSGLLPDMEIHQYPHIPDASSIEYAAVWDHPHGDLANYPNLKAILVLGAGTDHLDTDPNLPRVPIVRLIDPAVVTDMALFCMYWVMHFHRRYEDYRNQAQNCDWQVHEVSLPSEFNVTVLGLGEIGSEIARRFALMGYRTRGWSQSPKSIHAVESFHGGESLKMLLSDTQALITCLPHTDATAKIINQQTLSWLPKGAFLINPGRGALIDDDALVKALNCGQIGGAALDCFVEEPLPAESPYWANPSVFVTPHIAGATYARSAATVIVDNIRRIQNGEQPFPIHIPPLHRAG